MTIPTEPVGSVPRPAYLLEAMQATAEGRIATRSPGPRTSPRPSHRSFRAGLHAALAGLLARR
ncbi:MAG: hypothetical protein KJ066_20565 [Acidobacteria bacterium]|nr:hypothetical protein [Acidobacteriota bacterium]